MRALCACERVPLCVGGSFLQIAVLLTARYCNLLLQDLNVFYFFNLIFSCAGFY